MFKINVQSSQQTGGLQFATPIASAYIRKLKETFKIITREKSCEVDNSADVCTSKSELVRLIMSCLS